MHDWAENREKPSAATAGAIAAPSPGVGGMMSGSVGVLTGGTTADIGVRGTMGGALPLLSGLLLLCPAMAAWPDTPASLPQVSTHEGEGGRG